MRDWISGEILFSYKTEKKVDVFQGTNAISVSGDLPGVLPCQLCGQTQRECPTKWKKFCFAALI